jgi:hypothetical protein
VITVSSYYALNLPQRQTDRQTDRHTSHTHAPLPLWRKSFNKRHLNDIWRVPVKRPSPHSEVGSTQQKPGAQDSISSWSRGGGTKLMTSS